MASSSASSSVTAASAFSKQDQVIHRCYLKTVGVLVDGRLTHYGNGTGKANEKKKDKWVSGPLQRAC
jgi:autophagy-related protein 13